MPLRPLDPVSRIVGEAFTVEGHDIPRVGWDEGIVRMRPYLEMFERLTPDSLLVSTTPGGEVGHFGFALGKLNEGGFTSGRWTTCSGDATP